MKTESKVAAMVKMGGKWRVTSSGVPVQHHPCGLMQVHPQFHIPPSDVVLARHLLGGFYER
ncbi:MAG: hypothetical protein GC193_13165 [Cryomorphaceae bacterium]|nr:hypothetical protein [Cryomorphaceae bacterium]